MTRLEALIAVVCGLLMVTAGLVWLFGPFGLLGSGIAVAAGGLLLVDVKE